MPAAQPDQFLMQVVELLAEQRQVIRLLRERGRTCSSPPGRSS